MRKKFQWNKLTNTQTHSKVIKKVTNKISYHIIFCETILNENEKTIYLYILLSIMMMMINLDDELSIGVENDLQSKSENKIKFKIQKI